MGSIFTSRIFLGIMGAALALDGANLYFAYQQVGKQKPHLSKGRRLFEASYQNPVVTITNLVSPPKDEFKRN